MITNEDFLEMYCYPHTKAEAAQALRDLIASKPKPEGKTKEGIKMQLSDSSIQVQLYGNDGNDGQEVIKGDKAKEHLIKWIYDWMDEYAAQAISEHEQKVSDAHNEGLRLGIRICNAEYKVILNEIYKEFNNMPRITKGAMIKTLVKFDTDSLGDCINPDMEDVGDELPTPYKEDKPELRDIINLVDKLSARVDEIYKDKQDMTIDEMTVKIKKAIQDLPKRDEEVKRMPSDEEEDCRISEQKTFGFNEGVCQSCGSPSRNCIC